MKLIFLVQRYKHVKIIQIFLIFFENFPYFKITFILCGFIFYISINHFEYCKVNFVIYPNIILLYFGPTFVWLIQPEVTFTYNFELQ